MLYFVAFCTSEGSFFLTGNNWEHDLSLECKHLPTVIISPLHLALLMQVRLAHKVLQKVVTRYLQRDNLPVSSFNELWDNVGGCIKNLTLTAATNLWMNFTFFDPYCCGYKLVGAGGGGFALLFAKKAESGNELKYKLEDSNFNIKVYKLNIHLEN